MPDLVTNELFELEKTYEYILSIQVSLGGFSFSVLSENKIIAYKKTQLKISSASLISRRFNDWIESENLLQKTFKKVQIIVFTENFTLVPEKYFSDNSKIKMPEFLFEESDDAEIAVNSIVKTKSRLLFTLPTGINEVINKQIGECEIAHPLKIVLNNLPEINKENGLVLFFDKNNFYIVLHKKNKILLTNTFKTGHANDVIYYVLATFKQLEISTSKTILFLTTTNSNPPEITDLLQPYFSEIKSLNFIALQSF